MTRRYLVVLAGVLLFFGVAINAPAPIAEAAGFEPATPNAIVRSSPVSIRFGDGVFTLRIQVCGTCRTSVTIEVRLGAHAAPHTPQPVNHFPSAA